MRRSSRPGFELQLDCPDLAMSRHTGYQDMDEADSSTTVEANVEALNAATANIAPEQMRMHVCWGNYEGPHDHDIPVERIMRHRPQGAARDHPVRGRQPAPRA